MTNLEERREQSNEGLELVRKEAGRRLPSIIGDEPLAIYVTGSFGRLEAAFPKKSDLDLFFLYGPDNEDPDAVLPNLVWIEIASEMIKIARELEFDKFSGDGAFLRWHNVWYIGKQLGSPKEDDENGFTARLLLLLESRHILNEALYERLMLDVIGFYYRDYAANRDSFRPTFLINDILRFWRTLCLNYENKRNRKRDETYSEEAQTKWRADSASDNVKLRFSRLSTCYSMVAALASEPTPVEPERILELCKTPSMDRWTIAARGDENVIGLVTQMRELYEAFLGITEDKGALLARLADPDERRRVRDEANRYGELVSDLLLQTTTEEQRRTLLI
jgi:hypothetical protein